MQQSAQTFAVQGKFDTSLEAEYPTKFCRVLTQAVAEELSMKFGIKWNFKQLKTSQLAAVASDRQPKSLPNLVHEFSSIVPVHNVPLDQRFALQGKKQLKRCYCFVSSGNEPIYVHRGAKLLRRTEKAGDASAPPTTYENFEFEDNSLSKSVNPAAAEHLPSTLCNTCGAHCKDITNVALKQSPPSCEVVFGVPCWEGLQCYAAKFLLTDALGRLRLTCGRAEGDLFVVAQRAPWWIGLRSGSASLALRRGRFSKSFG